MKLTETEKAMVAVMAYDAVATGKCKDSCEFILYVIARLGNEWMSKDRGKYLEAEYLKQKRAYEDSWY